MELTLTPDARQYIDEQIARLKRTDTYYNTLVDRANIYMPFVEEAFDMVGVPQDLKYIVLQESALVGDAVSSSNAVGFWQFKDFTAREMGLTVDTQLDERKHIFLSSVAAARYFYRLNGYYGNWVYAVIAYNQGPSGALPYTDADLFCTTKMTVTGETHWYALKAIAHKLAFEDGLGKSPPKVELTPVATTSAASIPALAEQYKITPEKFKSYNLWILQHLIPSGRQFIYYVPSEVAAPVAVTNDHNPALPEIKPPVKESPPLLPTVIDGNYLVLSPTQDPDYGREYVFVKEGEILLEIARRYGVNLKKLNEWNGLSGYEKVAAGTVIRMKPISKSRIHIVHKGENLALISADYGVSVEKLRKINRLGSAKEKLAAGQKIYLKGWKPEGEKPIVVLDNAPVPDPDPVPVKKQEPPVKTPVVKVEPVPGKRVTHSAYINRAELHLPEQRPAWTWHTVGANESIWQISKRYEWPVAMIKKINDLDSDKISPGMKLKMLER